MNGYYDQEDTPDMSKPEVALDMFRSQVGGLMPLADIEDGVAQTSEALKRVLALAKASGNAEAEADVRMAHKALKTLHKQVVARDATISGAKAALDAEQAARKAVVKELEDLKDALISNDQNHPFIDAFISSVWGEFYSDAYEMVAEEMTLEDLGFDVNAALEAMHIKLDGEDVLRAIDAVFEDPSFPDDVKGHMVTFLKALEAYEDAKSAAEKAKWEAAWKARQARENGGEA